MVRLVRRWRRGADDAESEHHGHGLHDLDDLEMADLSNDARTKTIMVRAKLCRALNCDKVVKTDDEVTAMQNNLFDLISEDPYLSETITSPDVCATLGRIKYVREVMLGLQPDQDAVMDLCQKHRDMIETITEANRSLLVEVGQLMASQNAEEKALKDEEKAAEKETKRLEKIAEREQKKTQKKQEKEMMKNEAAAERARSKAEEKAQAAKDALDAEAEAAKTGEPPATTTGKGGGKRRARVGAASELSAYDPTILRCKLPASFHTSPYEDLTEFIRMIACNIDMVHLLKSKATFKKAIQHLPHISKDSALSYSKKLQAVPLLVTMLVVGWFGLLVCWFVGLLVGWFVCWFDLLVCLLVDVFVGWLLVGVAAGDLSIYLIVNDWYHKTVLKVVKSKKCNNVTTEDSGPEQNCPKFRI